MEPLWVNEDKLLSAENDYIIYAMFYVNHGNCKAKIQRRDLKHKRKWRDSENKQGNPPSYKSGQKQKEKETGYKISRRQKVK